MSDKAKILVIVGTVRQGRVGRKIGEWYLAEARKAAPELEFELLDAAEENLPLFNEPVPPLYRQYSSLQEELARKIGAADGYVFVTGEYNHSIPGSLKNLIDYLAVEWGRKVAAFVGYGSVGAIRAIEHLIPVLGYLKVATIPNHITINMVWEALDDQGVPKKGYVFGNIGDQIKELEWWVKALKAAR
jgi:NAD(P)H-dependent FMN reductase